MVDISISFKEDPLSNAPKGEPRTVKLNTYLNFDGNCAEAFDFYEKHLGGKLGPMMTYGDSPAMANFPPGTENRIIHTRIALGGTELYGSDTPPGVQKPMRSAYLSLSVDSSEEAERIHTLLSEGGEVFMPMEETFFAHRFSMLRDRFGVLWMVIHEKVMH